MLSRDMSFRITTLYGTAGRVEGLMYPRVILGRGRERRQYQGHPWVYDGEIASVTGQPGDGAVVDCYSHGSVFLGRGYFNSRSKIRLRRRGRG